MTDGVGGGRKFVVASVIYMFLEIEKKNPDAQTLRRVEDAMFLPRVVDRIRTYLGKDYFLEIEECMVLSDFKDDETDLLLTSINRIQAQLLDINEVILSVNDPREFILDWLLDALKRKNSER